MLTTVFAAVTALQQVFFGEYYVAFIRVIKVLWI
jgi:hypothetical protein